MVISPVNLIARVTTSRTLVGRRPRRALVRALQSVVGTKTKPEPGERKAETQSHLELLHRFVAEAELRNRNVRKDHGHRSTAEPVGLDVPVDLVRVRPRVRP